eukprot:489144-Pyramimonas_sp.AAC.1
MPARAASLHKYWLRSVSLTCGVRSNFSRMAMACMLCCIASPTPSTTLQTTNRRDGSLIGCRSGRHKHPTCDHTNHRREERIYPQRAPITEGESEYTVSVHATGKKRQL